MNEGQEMELTEELADFVALLRGATPEPAWMDAVEASVVAKTAGAGAPGAGGGGAGAGASATGGVMVSKVVVVMLALGVALGGARLQTPGGAEGPDPTLEAPRGANEAASKSRAAEERDAAQAKPAGRCDGGRRAEGPRGARAERAAQEPRAAQEHRAAQEQRGAQTTPDDATMTFELAETAPAAPDNPSMPPSEMLATGLRAYAAEDYLDAAVALRPVIEGRSSDARGNVEKARFFLAKSLHHLGFDHGAAVVLEEITRDGADGAYFDEALPWLAAVAERIPDDPILIEAVGRYQASALFSVDSDQSRDRYDHLLYLMGRARYDQRRLDEAIALFRRIHRDSEHWVPARFFTAVSHVRERRARPAVAAFRSVIEAIESGRDGDIDDPERMKNLAWLSLGRVYYTAANARDAQGDIQVDGRLLGAAIDAWERIPESSEYWLDALFEASWAFFVAEQYDRALGRIHALQSPYFADAYYPEADVVRAVILFSHCQLDAAESLTERFHHRYDGIHGALSRIAAARRDPSRAYALYAGLQNGDAGLHPIVARLLRRELSDRELIRSVALEAHVRDEAGRAGELAGDPRTAALGAWLGQELAVVGALSLDRAGELVSARLERLAEDLGERINDIDAVNLEIQTQRRTAPPPGAARDDDVQIVADQEHMIWPFDGEYWSDEIPYYRARVQNRCTR